MSWFWHVFVYFDSSLCFLDLDVCFLPQSRAGFNYYFLKICPLFSFFFRTPIIQMLFHLVASLSFLSLLMLCNSHLSLFQLYCFILSSMSLINCSASYSMVFIALSLLLISFIAFFISDWFFFNSFISVVMVSLSFSIFYQAQ